VRRPDRRNAALRRTLLKAIAIVVTVTAVALASYPVWKPLAKRSKWFVVATNVYQDAIRRFHLSRNQIGEPYTTTPAESDVPAHLAHVDAIFSMYLDRLGWSAADVRGKTFLEIGPGGNVGVALRFLASGAERVIAIDKFVPFQTSPFHRALYRSIRNRLSPEEQRRYDRALDLTTGVVLKPGPFTYIYGHGIEDAAALIPPHSIDVIASNAVLEEVYRIDEAWAALDRVWRPGGSQVHKIDLSDYGMFTKHGFHPLEFLTIPDGVYRFMAESVGSPNRRRVDYYRAKMRALGYDATISTTWLLGRPSELVPPQRTPRIDSPELSAAVASVREIRPRLIERYRNLSDEDLMVQGIVLVARKPASGAVDVSIR
jgi:hypothetical protein